MKDIAFPKFELYCKTVIIKSACYWNKNRPANQKNIIESPVLRVPYLWTVHIYQRSEDMRWNKENIFSKWCWKKLNSHINTVSHIIHKSNSK